MILLLVVSSLLALSLAAWFAIKFIERPRLDSLDPEIGEAGGELVLAGRNFGSQRGESRVELEGIPPTSASYQSWSDVRIVLRLPATFDSGLLHVVTRQGRSNPRLFMNRARLPVLASGDHPLGSPHIASISPEEGSIGSLLVVAGSGFGEAREGAEVLFSWAYDGEGPRPQGDFSLPRTVVPDPGEKAYESWSDKELRIRVPDGAISGPVFIETSKGRSNAFFFHVSQLGGGKRYFAATSYSISQRVSISRIKANGPAELYLWAPLPVRTASQRLLKVIGQEPEPMVADYRGTSLFRLAELATGRNRRMDQSFLIQVFATEAEVDPTRARPGSPPALMETFAAPDELVPSAAPAIVELANKITRGERSSWKAVRMVWDWLVQNLAWSEAAGQSPALKALAAKKADSYSYAILACALLRASGLPSLPVAGYLVGTDRRAIRHYWVEVYLYGLGWLPLDPVLGSGAQPGGIAAPWEDRSRYLGGLDSRHLAFSRGFTALAPLSPEGRRASKDRRWSFQSFYEEASGALQGYSSFWGDIEVTGMY